jgi:aspartyl-tRNA(Asn)/glutamyl-tRNA(Gln) amidotransferase subunit A
LAPGVADTALLLDVCAGPDPRDRTCLPAPRGSYQAAIAELDVTGLRVAFSPNFGIGPVAGKVLDVASSAFDDLVAAAGLLRVEHDARLSSFYDTYAKLEGVDRWIDLPPGLWPERAEELGPDLERGWRSSERSRLPQLAQVFTERRRIEATVAGWFDHIDILVTPTLGIPPFAAEGPLPEAIDGVAVHPFVGLSQPIVASLCNLPAMSIPAGLTSDGLPVGIQIIGERFREDRCLRIAKLHEEVTPWPRLPDLGQGFLPPL